MSSPAKGFRVLVVEDDAPLREAVSHRMRRLGHAVDTASSAEAALVYAACAQLPYDVVITDVHLPKMDGVQLAGILLRGNRAQRVVIVTGDHDPTIEALAKSRVSYLLKPFELSELEALVDERNET